ncbi:MAG TPA: phosphodiesterase, partial [Myxococcales bacterium]|nr:phosphodiesterase [Myxococcales bacterium]
RHDPRLFAVFARTMGFFPIGSVVQLATGEAAVVAGVPSDPAKLLQPPVILATGPNPGALANLALPEQAPRRIVRAALPSELGVNPLRWLVGG